MKKVLGLSVFLAVAQVAQAADIEAGNLAAQGPAYIEAQLQAFKDGTRKHSGATSHTDIMNVIQLSAQDIANVAAYFASQSCAAMGAKSRPE